MVLFAGPQPDPRAESRRFSTPAWRRLRALRHEPPGYASSGKKRSVFNAALEQSEQLFAAAASAGYATRPILAFYGLSQAGRAIAAAAKCAGKDWNLSGHGIVATNLDQDPSLESLHLINKGRGSFTVLARMLGSSSLPNETDLGSIWACLPELQGSLIGNSSQYPNVLRFDIQHSGNEDIVARISGIPESFLCDSVNVQEVEERLSCYPSLTGGKLPDGDLANVSHHYRATGASPEIVVFREWKNPPDMDINKFIREKTQIYTHEGDRWVFPASPGERVPIHPLIAWWGLLYSLSMLARYQPSSWSDHLDLDHRETAVPLELALDAALVICPELILNAIWQVSS